MDITDLPPEPPGPLKPPKKTALQKLQEHLDREMRLFKEIQKMQDQLRPLRQLEEFQQQLKRYSPEQQLRDLMKPFGSERFIRDMLDANNATEHLQGLHLKIGLGANGMDSRVLRRAAGLDHIGDLAKKMLEVHLPEPSAYEKLIEQIQRQALSGLSIQEFTRQVESANPAMSAIESAMRSFDSLADQFRNIDFSAYEQALPEQVKEQIEIIAQAAAGEDDLQATIDQIAVAVSAHPSPTVRLFLWLYFRTLLGYVASGIVSTVISLAVTAYIASLDSAKSPQDASKGVKEAGRSVVTAVEMLKEHRFVSREVLAVRMNPKAQSPELGRLKFGNVVQVLKNENKFALVVWSDNESGVEIQGWVFARYLSKFN